MKLSDAIRLGAMLKAQAFGYLFDETTSCAQGAALEAVGVKYIRGRPSAYYHRQLDAWWPWLKFGAAAVAYCPDGCPDRGTYFPLVSGVIAHLNNEHRWTREQIADWVATVEPDEMKLSEAIRLGSLVTRQGWGPLSFFSWESPCALGAALRAIGHRFITTASYEVVRETWPWITTVEVCPSWITRPSLCRKAARTDRIICHLNDEHRWTREQIADWVATIEPEAAQDSPTVMSREHTPNLERTPA